MEKSILFIPSLGDFDLETLSSLKKFAPDDWNFYIFQEPMPEIFYEDIEILPELLLKRSKFLKKYLNTSRYDLVIVSQVFHPATIQLLEISKIYSIPSLLIVPEIFESGERTISLTNFFKSEELNYLNKLGLVNSIDPDYICTWSSVQFNYFSSVFNNSKTFITGHPILDKFKPQEQEDGTVLIQTSDSEEEFRLKVNVPQNSFLVSIYLDYFSSRHESLDLLTKLDLMLQQSGKYAYVRNFAGHRLPDSYKNIRVESNLNPKFNVNMLDGIRHSDLFISNHTEHTIYATLLGKVPAILDLQGTDPLGLVEQGGIELIKDYKSLENVILTTAGRAVQNLNPHQLNFFLLNFLPCTLDISNTKRVLVVMEAILKLGDLTKKNTKEFFELFESRFPQLIDPLVKEKELVNRTIEGIEV